jgi:hypothetical protein
VSRVSNVVIVISETFSMSVIAAQIAAPLLSSLIHAVFSIENEKRRSV